MKELGIGIVNEIWLHFNPHPRPLSLDKRGDFLVILIG